MRRGVGAFLVAAAITMPIMVTIHRHVASNPASDAYAWWNSLKSSYSLDIHPSKSPCDPYALPGTLNVDASNIDENRWIPFDERCQAPRLFERLLIADLDEELDHVDVEDMQWVRNRTVVLFGDSVARENIVYFCELVGSKLERITWDHPFAPSPRPTHTSPPLAVSENLGAIPQDPDADPALVEDWQPKSNIGNGEQAHMGHICRVKKWGLVLVQQFQYGMDQEDYWSFKAGYIPPGSFEDRLHALLHPIVQAAIEAYQPTRTAPDLVMVNSAFWDTARWVREDMRFERDLDAGLSRDRLNWYRARVCQAVHEVKKLYPTSAVSWVTHHYPTGNGPSDWFTAGIPQVGHKSSARPGNTVLRLSELDAASRTVFGPSAHHSEGSESSISDLEDVRINEWGRIMLGQEKHMKDALHQALIPGGRLWADMMLFDLQRAVWTSEKR